MTLSSHEIPSGAADPAPGPTEWEGVTPPAGVGPMPWPWPDDPRLDPDLLAAGDRRNVIDRYRYWRHEAIVADLTAAGTRSTWRSRTSLTI